MNTVNPRVPQTFSKVTFALLTLIIVTSGAGQYPGQASTSSIAKQTCLLSWAPPELNDPEIIIVEAGINEHIYRLGTNTDYIIDLPNEPIQGHLGIEGGRNIVLIGGHISIPWQGANTNIRRRTLLTIRAATGIVHIEGLLGDGIDLTEGIQIDAPEAIVQIQNVRIENVHARDQVGFTDNHPDLIQSYGNAREIRIDRFTGSTDYQGFNFAATYNRPHGAVDVRRANLIGLPTARYLWWVHPERDAEDIMIRDVWIQVPMERDGGLARAVWPDTRGEFPNKAQISVDADDRIYATWPSEMEPLIKGAIWQGLPPNGDFVMRENLVPVYNSPGYSDRTGECA